MFDENLPYINPSVVRNFIRTFVYVLNKFEVMSTHYTISSNNHAYNKFEVMSTHYTIEKLAVSLLIKL